MKPLVSHSHKHTHPTNLVFCITYTPYICIYKSINIKRQFICITHLLFLYSEAGFESGRISYYGNVPSSLPASKILNVKVYKKKKKKERKKEMAIK